MTLTPRQLLRATLGGILLQPAFTGERSVWGTEGQQPGPKAYALHLALNRVDPTVFPGVTRLSGCVNDAVREVRKLNASGQQTSLISSAYGQLAVQDTAGLFSRWCQENFFRYMMEHYAIELLSEYQTEEIPGTNRPLVNPRWRELDRGFRSLKTKLQRRHAEFAAVCILLVLPVVLRVLFFLFGNFASYLLNLFAQ